MKKTILTAIVALTVAACETKTTTTETAADTLVVAVDTVVVADTVAAPVEGGAGAATTGEAPKEQKK